MESCLARRRIIRHKKSTQGADVYSLAHSGCGQAPLPRGGGGGRGNDGGNATKSSSCRVCTTVDGRVANDMSAVDRELALLEQSNAALFAALAQTRAMPVSRLPPALDGKTLVRRPRDEPRKATAADYYCRTRRTAVRRTGLLLTCKGWEESVFDF